MYAVWYLEVVEVLGSRQVAEQDGVVVNTSNEDLCDDAVQHGDHDGSEAHQEHVPVVEVCRVSHGMHKIPV